MWNLPGIGLQPLHPTQVSLLLEPLAMMVDQIKDEHYPWESEVDCIDRMSDGEKLLAIKTVICEACNPTMDAPLSSGWHEAMVYAILGEASDQLDIWEDNFKNDPDPQSKEYRDECRRLIKNVGVKLTGWHRKQTKSLLREMFLWDTDFLLESIIQDSPPNTNRKIKAEMGIEPDYFNEPGPAGNKTDEKLAEEWLICLHAGNDDQKPSKADLSQKVDLLKKGEAVRLLGVEREAMLHQLNMVCYPLADKPLNRMLIYKHIPWDGKPFPYES